MQHLAKNYHPKDFENYWYEFWMQKGFFKAQVSSEKSSYVILMPPPNVTSQLHMGHALNNTLIDVLIRWHRLLGLNVLYQAGTDHAGIATQNALEKELKTQGLFRHDFSRDEFVQELIAWKTKYGSRIIGQLKSLGCACDWGRERFTLDEGLSESVRALFVRLYDDGLIYKGEYVVNWCVRCGTALSNEEVEHELRSSFLYYIEYPLYGGDGVVPVATTRPETIFGDGAVAVHPDDERYRHLVGEKLLVPLVNRVVPIIADESIKKDFGTGAVKITPAHDFNDFLLGQRHGVHSYVVMSKKGVMTHEAGEYEGLDRFESRKRVLDDLSVKGLLMKKESYQHQVGVCYRCHEVIEPYLSSQWFVKMKPLAEHAIRVFERGDVKFYPSKWGKTYLHWLNNIEDWCISRQIMWGHRIPVWTCRTCEHIMSLEEDPQVCPQCHGGDLVQEEDVLDTWFSSMLWPVSPFGWPEETPELKSFYPSNVLITAPEIVFFWVARMIMAGLYLRGTVPFSDVYLHSTVRDVLGRKMSKSLGNGIDPLEVIEEYGTDALRFTLVRLAPMGEDVKLSFQKTGEADVKEDVHSASEDDFLNGARFANKVWNLARFILNGADGVNVFLDKPLGLELADQWILGELLHLAMSMRDFLREYRFDYALKAVYHFIWHDVCDYYLELSKRDIYGTSSVKKEKTVSVLLYLLKESLKLLHPFMPFVSEEIWSKFPCAFRNDEESILSSPPCSLSDSIQKSIYYSGWYDVVSSPYNLEKLPEEYMQVITLYYHEELTYEEIAEVLHISSDAVRSQIHEGIKLLQEQSKLYSENFQSYNFDITRDFFDKSFKVSYNMKVIIDYVKKFRRVRAEYNIHPQQPISIFIVGANKLLTSLFYRYPSYFSVLAKLERIEFLSEDKLPKNRCEMKSAALHCFISIPEESMNKDLNEVNTKMVLSQIDSLKKRLVTLQKRLQNPQFLQKAKKDIIHKTTQEYQALQSELKTLQAHVISLNKDSLQ